MTQKQRDIFACYVLNQRDTLEKDIEQLQSNLRFRKISQIDCLELVIAQERLNTFNDVVRDVNSILKVTKHES